MRVESLRKHENRAEEHGSSPELRQPLALHLEVLHVLRVGRQRDLRDRLIEHDVDRRRARRIDVHLHGLAVEIPRRVRPLLPLAAIARGKLHRLPVAAMEGLVHVQQPLHPVVAGLDPRERIHGIAERRVAHDRLGAGRESVHVHAEHLLRCHRVRDLLARLLRAVGGDEQQHPPVERLRALRGCERDPYAQGRAAVRFCGRGRSARAGDECCGEYAHAHDGGCCAPPGMYLHACISRLESECVRW